MAVSDRMVGSQEQLYSISGRKLSLVPKFNAATRVGTTRAVRAVAEWLVTEARAEVAATGDDWGSTLLRGLDPKNMSPADYDTANLFLFGEPDGPTGKHRTGASCG